MNIFKALILVVSLFLLCSGAVFSEALFEAAQNFNVGDNPRELVAIDFDEDDTLDIVTVNISSNDLSVMIGNGNGTFGGAVSHALTSGMFPKTVKIADINRSGSLDVVAGGFAGIDILYGSGIGTFYDQTNLPVGAVDYIALGDFDNDTWVDIASTRSTVDSVGIHINNGNNTFTSSYVAVDNGSLAIAAAPVDNNSSIDLVVSCNNGSIWKLLNDGSGNFTPTVFQYDTLTNQPYIALADFNGNGTIDLAATNNGTDSLTIYNNDGTSNFVAYYNYLVGTSSTAVIAEDLDGDSIVDLVVADRFNDEIRFFKGNGNFTFTNDTVYTTGGGGAIDLAAGDFDEDGYIDLAVTACDSGWVSVFMNRTALILDTDEDTGDNLPRSFGLEQNYPNPFNPSTSIEFSLPTRSRVSIDIYNLLGQKIYSLVDDEYAAGSHTVEWDGITFDGTHAGTGVYFYRLETEEYLETRKMMLLK